jgi:hypothetical protein
LADQGRKEQGVPGAPGVEPAFGHIEAVPGRCQAEAGERHDAALVVAADVRPTIEDRRHVLLVAVGGPRQLSHGNGLASGQLVDQPERQRRVVAAGEGAGQGVREGFKRQGSTPFRVDSPAARDVLGVVGQECTAEPQHLQHPLIGNPVEDVRVAPFALDESAPAQTGQMVRHLRLGLPQLLDQLAHRQLAALVE